MRALVLGGTGAYGAYVVAALAASDEVGVVVICGRDGARAERLAGSLAATTEVLQLDVSDGLGLGAAVADCDVVVNAAGPAYSVSAPVLSAAIAAGADYVDLCDDARALLQLLELDGDARAGATSAVLGCGCSPGVTNLACKVAAETLDQVESIDVMLAGGEGRPVAGPANVLHLLDLVHGSVPVVRDGRLSELPGFTELAEHDFGEPLGPVPCGLIAHPEPVMFLRSVPGLRSASAKLGVGGGPLGSLLRAASALGLTSDDPIEVGEALVSPRELVARHLYEELGFENEQFFAGPGAPTAVHVVLEGTSRGERRRLVCRLYADIGPLVGLAAAQAAVWLGTGRVAEPGVHLPEQLFDPRVFLDELAERGAPSMEIDSDDRRES